jgi:multidrug efflux pump subunit AcrB
VQVSASQIGGRPCRADSQCHHHRSHAPTQPEEFGAILLRVNRDGSQLLLRDVARVTLDAENFVRAVRYNGKPATAMAIRLAIGANALDTVDAINATLDRLKPFFPPSIEVTYPVDTSPFIRTSIKEVAKTLIEAIVLVFLVMYLFLQNFRATLIPTIAVPVVMLGTFGVLAAAGFSINTLTMFGMVLSIGLLVMTPSWLWRGVERVMSERGSRHASHPQVDGPDHRWWVASRWCWRQCSCQWLLRRFRGVIYRQFSITIVSAMVLSVLVALILTPALCAAAQARTEAATESAAVSSAGSIAFERQRSLARTARRAARPPLPGRIMACWWRCWACCSCTSPPRSCRTDQARCWASCRRTGATSKHREGACERGIS